MVDQYGGSKTQYDWPIKIRRAENTVLISKCTILKQRFDYIMTKPKFLKIRTYFDIRSDGIWFKELNL